ncbi:MAG: thermostable hemolysin [Hyphomicrobium sp.]|jgi:hypothetical protein
MDLIVVPADHDLRSATEDFIAEIYDKHYNARVSTFPPVLLAMRNADGELQCASGLRFAQNGFFSDVYLDVPVERTLSRATGRHISRGDVFEVTNLASRAPHAATRFLHHIIAYGDLVGFEWAFFTATARVRTLLQRVGLPMLTLAPAERSRVANPAIWGSYYAASPHVCAVDRAAAAIYLSQKVESAVHV